MFNGSNCDRKSQLSEILVEPLNIRERCTHLLYCSVLSLGGNVNTRRMSPDMGSIFQKSMKYSGDRKLVCELSKLSKFNAFNLLGY